MVHDMVDGIESARLVALNFEGREQLVCGEAINDFCRLVQGSAEPVEKFRGSKAPGGRELRGTVALIFVKIKRGYDPLDRKSVV